MCGGFHDAAGGDILIDHKVLEGYLRKLYGGKFDVSKEIEPTIWREVLRLLNEATVEGLSQSQLPPTYEQEFYKELRHSNEVFAAFKVHKMGSLMALKLTDEDGKLKSYRQWKEDIKGISNHFLNAWLKTEYNTAVIRAHNAADWRQFERNKDIMPNLRWMPTVSPNPEAEHRVFWERKLTRPIDDPFWNKHRPGNRWNCKCSLEATDEPITPLPTDAEIRGDQPQRGLENNPGKDGQLFSNKHPYFPKNCRECGFYKRKGKLSIKNWFKNADGDGNCNYCRFIDNCLPGRLSIQKETALTLKYIKKAIDQFHGEKINVKKTQNGRITVLRRSLDDIFEHARENIEILNWLQNFSFDDFKKMKYKGWGKNRTYDPNHPKYDPNDPQKTKHPEAHYFTYYTIKIGKRDYWVNVKMHFSYGETIYTVEKEKPDDLIKGKPPKIKQKRRV